MSSALPTYLISLWYFCGRNFFREAVDCRILLKFLMEFRSLIQLYRDLIFCVEFRALSPLTCDLSQAEKKITVVTYIQDEELTKRQLFSLKMKFQPF